MMLLCPKVVEIWPSIIKWWGVPKNRAMVRDIWFAIPATVAWLIWKGRNDLLFNQVHSQSVRGYLVSPACPIQKINSTY